MGVAHRGAAQIDDRVADDGGAHRGSSLAREVHAEGEDPVGEVPGGVADDGEVLEVALGLVHEPLTICAGDRRERTITHRGGAFAEPGDHCIDIQFVGHG